MEIEDVRFRSPILKRFMTMLKIHLLPVIVSMVAIGFVLKSPGAQPMNPTLLSQSSDRFLVDKLNKNPKRMVSGIAPDGAVGVNAEWEKDLSEHWFIELQRYGADLTQMGLAVKNNDLIEEGIRVLNCGFAHEADGSFPGTGDPRHSISFFLEAASRSVILFQEAGDSIHLNELKNWKENIRKAAEWLITPNVFPRDRARTMDPYTNRFFLCAAALGQAGEILDNSELKQAALVLAKAGLERQQSDGTNPERGGFDVSYQIVGTVFASRYLLVCGDSTVRAKMRFMIRKTLEKEKTALDENGNVSTAGSTRVTLEKGRNGRPKTMDYKMLLQALIFWSDISGESSWRNIAGRVAINRNW
jgi:hypothetical protein